MKYYNEGKLLIVEDFDKVIIFYKNGNKLFECNYKNNIKHGFEIWYYKDGTIYKSMEWNMGEPWGIGEVWYNNKVIKINAYKKKIYNLLWN